MMLPAFLMSEYVKVLNISKRLITTLVKHILNCYLWEITSSGMVVGILREEFSLFLQDTSILVILHLPEGGVFLLLHFLRRLQLEIFIVLLSLEKENCLACSLLLC